MNFFSRQTNFSIIVGLVLVGLLISLLPATACAAVVSLTPDADAFVKLDDTPTTYHGGETHIYVKNSNTGATTRKGYVRYDLSGSAGSFTDASLTFAVSTNNGSDQKINVYGIRDGNAGESWDEGSITWSTAPANSAANRLGPGTVFLGQVTVPNAIGDTFAFDSPTLRSFLNTDTDGQASVILTRVNGGSENLGFQSKEHGGLMPITLSGDRDRALATTAITTNDGNGADTYIQNGAKDTNFGTSGDITIKNSGSSSTTRKGYLRFDLSSLEEDATDAAIMFDVSTNNQGSGGTTPQEFTVHVFGLVDGHAGENWNETTMDWNDAPANGSNNGLTGDAIDLGEFYVSDDEVGSSALFTSADLVDFINADTNGLATFILRREDSNGSHNLVFASGEHASMMAPTLYITHPTAIPEPSTILLSLLGVVGLTLWGVRRRAK